MHLSSKIAHFSELLIDGGADTCGTECCWYLVRFSDKKVLPSEF